MVQLLALLHTPVPGTQPELSQHLPAAEPSLVTPTLGLQHKPFCPHSSVQPEPQGSTENPLFWLSPHRCLPQPTQQCSEFFCHNFCSFFENFICVNNVYGLYNTPLPFSTSCSHHHFLFS